jgi:hypothetical protein
MNKPPSRARARLKLPKYEVPRLVTYAQSIVQSMTGNSSFPSPEPPLVSVQSAIEDLSAAETATRSGLKGTVALRDEKRRALALLLQHLLSYIQATADAHADKAASIIESAGVSVEKPRSVKALVFAAKQGRVPGLVDLVAPSAARGAGYEWAYSLDGCVTWLSLPFTVRASTTVTDLTPGSVVHFRYRPVTSKGAGNWSDALRFIVQ